MTDQATFDQQSRGGGYCANCCFYDPLYGKTSSGEEVPVGYGGVCRKNAPTRMFQDTQPLQETSVSEPRPGMWPMTAAHDWCGDHPLRQAGARVTVNQLTADIDTRTKALEKIRKAEKRGAKLPGFDTQRLRS